MNNIVSFNGQNRLLAALQPADVALFSPHLREMDFPQGKILQEAGDAIEHVFFPITGMISLLAVMLSGTAVETATVGREGAVGTLVGLGARHAAGRAVVQVAGISMRISAAKFRTALEQSESIRTLVLRYNEIQTALVLQSAGCNALHSLENRLCRWLLQTRDRSDSDILSLTHEFLSEMLGVQRTTVTLVARTLQSEGLIRYQRGRIEIIDRDRLEKRACECYAFDRLKREEVFSHHHSDREAS